jgi:Na+-transporting methylmalonyl-CoA/oxaloacetate decarboxylase gamma subunit
MSNMSFDLTIEPSTFDLWHVILASTAVFFVLLFLIVLIWGFSNQRTKVPAESEVKIVEKIVEIEKIVQSPAPEPIILREMTTDAAIQILAILQKEARFIDFIQEDMTAYSDAEIGGAARMVQQGCKKAIDEHFNLVQVASQSEGETVTLEKGYDSGLYRVIGHVTGEPPFKGVLVHKGWRVNSVSLPKLTESHDAMVIACAEVEL